MSGPIVFLFLLLSVIMNLATSCTAIGGMQKALAFRSLLWQNSFSVEEYSYSFRTSVSCLDEVRFSANEGRYLLKESGVILLTELLECGQDFLVISLTARQIVAVSLLSERERNRQTDRQRGRGAGFVLFCACGRQLRADLAWIGTPTL